MPSFTELVRRDVKKQKTSELLSKYKTFNKEGREETRRELERRGVAKNKLPYKPRGSTTSRQQSPSLFGGQSSFGFGQMAVGSVSGFGSPRKKKPQQYSSSGYW